LQLCEIPDLNARLDLLLFILEFPLQYEELSPVRIDTWVALSFLKSSSHETKAKSSFLHHLLVVKVSMRGRHKKRSFQPDVFKTL
jgi:hypothetical protein